MGNLKGATRTSGGVKDLEEGIKEVGELNIKDRAIKEEKEDQGKAETTWDARKKAAVEGEGNLVENIGQGRWKLQRRQERKSRGGIIRIW
jgi:hypothetical protein